MAFKFLDSTKFATFNLEKCRVADDFEDPLVLAHNISIHRTPLFKLGAAFEERMGADNSESFNKTNVVIMASRVSATPLARDAESKELDRRAYMMLCAILVQGTVRFSSATIGSGGVIDGRINVLHVDILPPFYYATAVPTMVSRSMLASAEGMVGGFINMFGAPAEQFGSLRRGVSVLIDGWKTKGVLERLHAFVRALDGLMQLPQGAGRVEFVNRVDRIVTGQARAAIAEEIYLLRNHDEHLSDWPTQLAHITETQREEFVARRSYLAESIAGHAYRTVLTDANLLARFVTRADIETFWQGGGGGWTHQLDLDAEGTRYRYLPR